MLTFVIFVSLGGLRKVQKQLKSFPVNLKSQGQALKTKQGFIERILSLIEQICTICGC